MYGAILGDIIGSPFELLYHLKDRSNKRLSIRQRKSITRRITQPFQVYLKSKGSYDNCADDERATIKTDADGYAVTGDLVYGTYVVHQVDSGDVDAYYVDDFEAKVTENGKVYEFEKVNELFKAYFKIIKKDKNAEKTVLKPGTSYQIYQVVDRKEELVTQEYMEDGEKKTADTFICDESGEVVTVDSLRSGTYHIYEVAAADGMHINHQYVEVVVNSKADNYESYIDKDGCPTVTIWTRHRSTFIWSIRMQRQRRSQQRQSRKTHRQPMWSARLM